jgi:CheY-like chemotaxis protein
VEIAAPKNFLTPCILDDAPAELDALASMVAELGYQPVPTADLEEALKAICYGRCRLVLADVGASGNAGYQFLDRALRSDPGLHVIVMTRDYTLDSALDCIRWGAADFLPKPVERNRLKRALVDVAALYDQRRRAKALEEQLLKDLEFHGIVGKSPAMLEVFDFARKVARHYGAHRHGKGTGGPRHSPAQPGQLPKAGGVQLFGDGGHLAGKPDVRATSVGPSPGHRHAAGPV